MSQPKPDDGPTFLEVQPGELFETKTWRVTEPYPPSFKTLQIRLPVRPKGARQWLRALWGFDLFIHRVPLIKLELAIFVAVVVVGS